MAYIIVEGLIIPSKNVILFIRFLFQNKKVNCYGQCSAIFVKLDFQSPNLKKKRGN